MVATFSRYAVSLLGSNELSKRLYGLAERFGAHLAHHTDLILVTGGTESVDSGATFGTSHIVASSMADRLRAGSDWESRIRRCARMITILPQNDDAYVRRGAFGRIIVPKASDRASRRYELVAIPDVVILVEGHGGSRRLAQYAQLMGKPVLPVPSSGGDARRFWEENRQQVVEQFALVRHEAQRLETSACDDETLGGMFLGIVRRATRRAGRA